MLCQKPKKSWPQILDSRFSLGGTRIGNDTTWFFKILIWLQADHRVCVTVPVVLDIFEEKRHLTLSYKPLLMDHKIFEHLIHQQLTDHLETILHNSMFGYTKYHGCLTAH